ncbi:hypothetical protein ACI3SI_11960, partial [Lactococcus lactis]
MALEYSRGSKVIPRPLTNLLELSSPTLIKVLKNWDNTYFGSMTVKSALALSRNIPAVKTLINVGLDNSSKFVNGLGIT